jgi:ABC-type Mn2+/Zn2+ transport system permease subunit
MNPVLDVLTQPLTYAFMTRGMLAALMVGVVCAVVGSYMVLRGMAFFSDALSHTILPGVALGYLFNGGTGGALFWWGLVTAIAASLGIGALSKSAEIKEDTAIGIVFAGMFALGVALISTVRSYTVDLTHLLFGNVLGVSTADLWLTAIFGGLIIITVLVLYKELLVVSFDPTLATTLRLPVGFLYYLLLVLIATAIVVSLQTVGITLVLALLVTPAATAFLLTRRLPAMMALAALIGAFSGVVGLYLSFYFSIASGAAIVLVCTAIFLLVFLFAPQRGWVWRGGK